MTPVFTHVLFVLEYFYISHIVLSKDSQFSKILEKIFFNLTLTFNFY